MRVACSYCVNGFNPNTNQPCHVCSMEGYVEDGRSSSKGGPNSTKSSRQEPKKKSSVNKSTANAASNKPFYYIAKALITLLAFGIVAGAVYSPEKQNGILSFILGAIAGWIANKLYLVIFAGLVAYGVYSVFGR